MGMMRPGMFIHATVCLVKDILAGRTVLTGYSKGSYDPEIIKLPWLEAKRWMLLCDGTLSSANEPSGGPALWFHSVRMHNVPHEQQRPTALANADPTPLSRTTRIVDAPSHRRTGLPGRRSSVDLIRPEMYARHSRAVMQDTLDSEMCALVAWLKENHPGEPVPKPKSLANALRAEYLHLQLARKATEGGRKAPN